MDVDGWGGVAIGVGIHKREILWLQIDEESIVVSSLRQVPLQRGTELPIFLVWDVVWMSSTYVQRTFRRWGEMSKDEEASVEMIVEKQLAQAWQLDMSVLGIDPFGDSLV